MYNVKKVTVLHSVTEGEVLHSVKEGDSFAQCKEGDSFAQCKEGDSFAQCWFAWHHSNLTGWLHFPRVLITQAAPGSCLVFKQ